MKKNIKIKIPQELKDEYKEQKHILIEERYKYTAESIEFYLNEDDIYGIYSSFIPCLANRVSFFKNYLEWLAFVLLELIASIGIDTNNENYTKDIYHILQVVRVILQHTDNSKITNKDYLMPKIKEYISTCHQEYITNPKAIEIYELFVNIGLGLINPEEIIDTDYNYYLKTKTNNSKVKKL